MAEQFGKNNFYTFDVDEEKNHIFLKPEGVWKAVDDVPDYIAHLEKALGMVKPGFTMMVDLADMSPPKLSVTKMLKENQQKIDNAGLRKSAVVVEKDQILKKLSLNVVTKLSGMKNQKIFSTKEEADAWLRKD